MGSHFGVGAPLMLEPILVGIGMFTGGNRDFDPWPCVSVLSFLSEWQLGLTLCCHASAQQYGAGCDGVDRVSLQIAGLPKHGSAYFIGIEC